MGGMKGKASPLRLRRLVLGLSQAEVSKRSAISEPHISRLERGVCDPTLSTIRKLGAALECEPTQLFELNAERPQNGQDPGANPGLVATSSAAPSGDHDSDYPAT